MNKKIKLLIAVFIILVSLGLSINIAKDFLNPIKFVSEVKAEPEQYINRNLQVAGLIVKESIRKEGSTYRFELTDENATINVEYTGIDPIPDLSPGVGVTLVGTLVSEDSFKATKILIKCPSKYQQEKNYRRT